MSDKPLDGVIIAFDVDNTLLDPSGDSYRRAVSEFLARVDLGLRPDEAFRAYEEVRAHGYAMQRLGLANPIHERGHPHALALLCLTHGAHPGLLFELGIAHDERAHGLALLFQLAELHDARRRGPLMERLHAEMHIRGIVQRGPDAQRFRAEVERVAEHPIIEDWANGYAGLEHQHRSASPGPLVRALANRGATVVVITEGRWVLQRRKLSDSGVREPFEGRALVTDVAASPPGLSEFDQALAAAIARHQEQPTRPIDTELVLLWYIRCVLDQWGAKTPSFYGRCLHALQADRECPEKALTRFAYRGDEDWRAAPLRFVMVGDRYDRDVLPLIELLGRDGVMTVRLTQGKYGAQHVAGQLPPDRRPTRTVSTWDALERLLITKMTRELVPLIETPPPVLHGMFGYKELIGRALESELTAVRAVGGALKAAQESTFAAT